MVDGTRKNSGLAQSPALFDGALVKAGSFVLERELADANTRRSSGGKVIVGAAAGTVAVGSVIPTAPPLQLAHVSLFGQDPTPLKQ